MSKTRAKKPQRSGPALLLLLACVSLATYRLKEHWLDGSLAGLASGAGAVDDAWMPEQQAVAVAESENWVDLLAKHGSCNEGQVVPLVFRFHPATTAGNPAPVGEFHSAVQAEWHDGDPPQVRIGVVMISEASRRAVIGNQVLGVGDVVAGGTVQRIERGSVEILWHRRTLTYELGEGFPIEFRSELAKRATSAPVRQDADGERLLELEKK
jgi:hypothetical protein